MEPARPAPLSRRHSQDGIPMKWTTFIACGVEQLTDFVVVPVRSRLGDNGGTKLAQHSPRAERRIQLASFDIQLDEIYSVERISLRPVVQSYGVRS